MSKNPKQSGDEFFRDQEAERRFQQTLRGALVTPHRPHARPNDKGKRKAKKGAGK